MDKAIRYGENFVLRRTVAAWTGSIISKPIGAQPASSSGPLLRTLTTFGLTGLATSGPGGKAGTQASAGFKRSQPSQC